MEIRHNANVPGFRAPKRGATELLEAEEGAKSEGKEYEKSCDDVGREQQHKEGKQGSNAEEKPSESGFKSA